MKNLLLIVLLSISSFWLSAQNKNLQFEIGGNSGLASLSFENQFKTAEKHISFYRVGFGVIPIDGFSLVIPSEIGRVLGKGKNHLEISTGITFAIAFTEDKDNLEDEQHNKYGMSWINRIGYRYQKTNGKFIFRAGFVAQCAAYNSNPRHDASEFFFGFQPFGGISFGYVLNGKKKEETP